MLPCNNTANPRVFATNRAAEPAKTGRASFSPPIIAAMSDPDELARRYFALWTEYLTALVADPQAAALAQRWFASTSQFASQFPGAPNERAGSPFPAWPPIPAATGPQAPAAAAAGASGERGDAVGQLARRVGELERRLAAVEQRPPARRPRRGDRPSGE